MIKVQPRANIPDEFVDEVVKISTQRIQDIQAQINSMSRDQAEMHRKKTAMTISRLSLLARRDPGAIDQMKTTLRGLPYTEYAIKTHDRTEYNWAINKDQTIHDTYLYGLSKDVIINRFNFGPYQVWIPVKAFTNNGSSNYQFIPERSPSAYHRTPHHVGGMSSNLFNSSTCWGGFGGIVQSLKTEADIPEFFRSIYIYLGRYNPGSPLAGARLTTYYFPFMRPL